MNESDDGILLPEYFTLAKGAAAGFSKDELLGPDLIRPFRGVRAFQTPATIRERCHALHAVMRPDQYFSHTTAAALWGLPYWLPSDTDLHVAARHPARAMRRKGVVGHQSKDDRVRVVMLRGLPVADPLATWSSLASMLDHDELVVVADALILKPLFSEWGQRVDLESLWQRAETYRGPLAWKLVPAARDARLGSESPMETRLRLLLIREGLPQPQVNTNVFDAEGVFLGRPDLCWPEYRAIAEYDGRWHNEPAQRRKDERRIARFEDNGWRHIRVVGSDLIDEPAATVLRVAAMLALGGWEKGCHFVGSDPTK